MMTEIKKITQEVQPAELENEAWHKFSDAEKLLLVLKFPPRKIIDYLEKSDGTTVFTEGFIAGDILKGLQDVFSSDQELRNKLVLFLNEYSSKEINGPSYSVVLIRIMQFLALVFGQSERYQNLSKLGDELDPYFKISTTHKGLYERLEKEINSDKPEGVINLLNDFFTDMLPGQEE